MFPPECREKTCPGTEKVDVKRAAVTTVKQKKKVVLYHEKIKNQRGRISSISSATALQKTMTQYVGGSEPEGG